MYISKIELDNFKSFKKIEVNCSENFNVIVGENNIGKSTIFEALNLWKYAYNTLIQTRNSKKFYKANANYYIPFSELSQIRLVNDDDIFYDHSLGNASITLTIADGNESFSLKIRFEKPGIKNSYLRVFNSEGFSEFERFSAHIESKECSLKNAIFIYQTRPISTIFKNEPFYNDAQIEKKISIGKSHDVLRNKILKTENIQASKVAEKFDKLEGRINKVLKSDYQIRFKNKNRIDEEYVRITAQCSSHRELEISMMGSGFLQVVEIFSTIEYIEKSKGGICLILIDEPDSHVHSDLQSHLIDELKSHDESQVYVISHNDRLINKVDEGELFYLNKTVKNQGVLSALRIDNFSTVKEGLASVLNEIENSRDKPIVLTEGKTDQKILEVAWGKLNGDAEMPFSIVSSGIHFDENSRTGNADTVRRSLEYLANIVDHKVIGLFDNDREGNECFRGLNKQIFEDHEIAKQVRKHRTKEIYGVTLPVPAFRSHFVNEAVLTQRYFVMEHYFSDEILDANNLKDDPILQGTDVFNIKGNKNSFSEICSNISPAEFESFRLLFDQLNAVAQVENP
ncbi:ATP-dependent nuclease [Modicisalibacter coralii]|uniref:ATP-dependent nuclease n=1 Tax=Modicisalibacter coralii TaxID=2304602 RepID=UPI00100A31A1|nr:AAA family ATPase [Halomonas coralii]